MQEERGNIPNNGPEATDQVDIPLEDVPDADAIKPGSPVDPAAQPVDIVHGTDLINGAGADEEDAPALGGPLADHNQV
ncbi:hypothetical protein DCC85_04730 [Paenibacillus sp. CAA11]|uniref:hypothetical protein n=1 Tax=Paenibacillus sp. CAA11 TaxID=1532905 RepID=UPI000D35D992|nr:hypothetical protein [Paenibacillus sp. CAA11]AWB43597.1 hypothetical protein DCC85_04730 [Paenibacillus sp. CAA11]